MRIRCTKKILSPIFVFWQQKIQRYTLNMDFNNSTFYLLVGYVLSYVLSPYLTWSRLYLSPSLFQYLFSYLYMVHVMVFNLLWSLISFNYEHKMIKIYFSLGTWPKYCCEIDLSRLNWTGQPNGNLDTDGFWRSVFFLKRRLTITDFIIWIIQKH